MEIKTLKTHIVKILTTLLRNVKLDFPDHEYPDVEFLFGGYSWIDKEFKIWNIIVNKETNSFIAKEVTTKRCMGMGKIAFAGDVGPLAKDMLFKPIKKDASETKGESLQEVQKEGWNMRPFCVLRDLLRSPDKPRSIGGAPQILKLYQHMNTVPLAVYWPNKESKIITIMGRPLQDYERTSLWVFDPDTLIGSKPKGKESF